MSAPPAPSARPWDHIRALLVTAHLLAITLPALPSPGRVSQRQLRDPALKEVFADWRGVMAKGGIELTQEEAEQLAMTTANAYMEARDKVIQPMRPYYRYAGTTQSWQMFGYLNRTPARLKVELLVPGDGWQELYVARSSTADWRRRQLDGERWRGMINSYSWKERRSGYRRFVDWLSCRAAEDFPEAKTLRVSMVQLRLPEAAKLQELGKVPEIKTFWTELRELDECVLVEETP